jgi:6-phosphogluconolactonase (cycloisomerase 2 family)
MLDQGRAAYSKSGGIFVPFDFFNVKSCSLLRSFSFVIAAALRLRLSIRAVRGLLTVVVAGITLPAVSTASVSSLQYVEVQKNGVSPVPASSMNGATDVAVSPDGLHVYVASYIASAVSIFSRNLSTGALTYVNQVRNGSGGVSGIAAAFGVAVSPDGNNVYVASPSNSATTVFSRDASTGLLTWIESQNTSTLASLSGVITLATSPDGKNVYAVTGGGSPTGLVVFTRSSSDGRLTYAQNFKDNVSDVSGITNALGQGFSPTASAIKNVCVSNDGSFLYITSSTDNAVMVFSRNTGTGLLTPSAVVSDGVGGVAGITGASSLVLSPDNRFLYVAGQTADSVAVFSRNAGTGALTYIGKVTQNDPGITSLDGARSLAVSPDGKTLYVSAIVSNSVTAFSRDDTTGLLTLETVASQGVGGVDGLGSVSGMMADSQSRNLYAAGQTAGAVVVFRLPAPSVTVSSVAVLSYSSGAPALAIDNALTVDDPFSATLASARISVSAGFVAGDVLSVTTSGAVTSSYDNATGVLTLSGTDTLSAYQAVLRTVGFRSTATDATSGGLSSSRTIAFTVTNGSSGSAAATRSIAVSAPSPASVPGAPTIGTATAGNGSASVSFTAPTSDGGAAITGYTVTSSPGGFTGTGSTSPITVAGIVNGTAYTFTVTATNSVGTGSASIASSAVTPATTPTVISQTSASVSTTSATLGGDVTATGGASLTAVGVVYSVTATNSNPQLSGTGVTNVAGTAATGVYTVNATGLTAGTAYSYAAYASNSQGTTYSSVGTFTTTVPTPTLTFTTPSTASVAVGATRANAVTSTLSGGSFGAISYTSSDTGKATVNPTTGVVTGLAVGTTTITATQAVAAGFNATTSTSYTLTVTIGTPTISAAPSATGIAFGQTLASSTLSGGTASVSGTFIFTTSSTAPSVGTAAQGVTFTPTDTTNYTSVTTTVNVTVAKATPTITWATPSAITYGTTLSATQLNATSSLTAGTIVYSPASGTTPSAGTQTLTATFTPTDTANYNTATGTVSLTVNKATPTITWATPSAITYGTTLSATQLNATSSLTAGTIAYSPASGTTPSAGTQTLTATFTPTDTANYNASTRTVSLVVNKATPTITWATPSTITVGTALSSTQLNATTSVAGTIAYSPASGSIPSAGTQTLSATFTPTDTANYNPASASVALSVVVAVPGSPTAITATTANGEATITFTAPSFTGSAAISGYTIRATATDGSTMTVNATGSPAKVTGLTPGKSYRFTVIANNSAGSSESSTVTDTLTISLVNQTISFAAPADRASNSGSFALSATASSGLPVTFTLVSGPGLLAGNVVDLTGATGPIKLRASQAGNATYAAAPEVEVTFAVTAGRTNVIFGQAFSSGSRVPAAELGVVLPGNGQPGSLLVVSTVIPGLNGVIKVEFTVRGGFIGTLVSSVAAAPLGARIQAAPVTYTITGTLLNGVLTGTIAPLGLVFTAPVPLPTGPSAAAAGLYVTGALVQAAGTVSAVVGANNEVLVLIQSATVTTGGLTTLKPDTTFALAAPGNGVIAGAVNPVTTSATATLTLPGSAPVAFSGLSTTTKRTDRLIGLATRAKVGIGESVLIAGVAIGGTESKRVLIRAGGPALAGFGLANTLANPTLKIYRGSTLIAQNDDWSPADAAETARLGLFAFPNGSKDAAILTTLEPGTYTAQVSDLSGTGTGVALAEIYDASVNPTAEYQRLVSIASRGTVTVGDGALIGGFVVVGNAPKTLLIRGIGPTLTRFGLVGVLADPVLTIYDGGEALATNAGWANSAAIATAATEAGAFALAAGSRDAALLVTLKPGSYTAQVKASQVTSSGVALIEIYEVP